MGVMVELLTLAAVALLVLGVVGSVVPLLPGPLLSLAGVYLYWWASEYTEPSTLVLVVLTLVGLLALVVNYFAGAVSARAGGASLGTTLLAAVGGIVLFFVAGPLGIILGVVGAVFAVEFYRHRDASRGAKTAIYTAIGMLASTVVQFLLTLSMLVTLVIAALL